MRLIIIGNARTHEIEALMDEELNTISYDKLKPYHALTQAGDGMPALGIVAAVLGVADHGEIGMVRRPVEHVPNRGDHAEGQERAVRAQDPGHDRVLAGHPERADDEHRLQPPALGQGQDRGAQHEAEGQDRRHRQEGQRDRNSGPQKHRHGEQAARALRQRLDAEVQVDAVDRVVAEIGHGPSI